MRGEIHFITTAMLGYIPFTSHNSIVFKLVYRETGKELTEDELYGYLRPKSLILLSLRKRNKNFG